MTEERNASVLGTRQNVPSSAAWLGGLGAVPFIALAGAPHFLSGGPTKIWAAHALVAYGAVILSFLGAVHWGLAIGPNYNTGKAQLFTRLVCSVIPSLVGWISLLVMPKNGLLILAAAIAAMLWFDLQATKLGTAPAWYPKLRMPLSLIVIGALLFGAMA